MSNLICSGQIKREEALKKLEEPIYNAEELIIDKAYVIKKLGFSEEEFDAIMSQKPKDHREFKTEKFFDEYYPIIKPFKKIYKAIKN